MLIFFYYHYISFYIHIIKDNRENNFHHFINIIIIDFNKKCSLYKFNNFQFEIYHIILKLFQVFIFI